MAVRLHELYPSIEYERVITPTGDELPDMLDHWRALQDRLGPLTAITCGESLQSLIDGYGSLPNWRQRWCTRQLKIEPYMDYLQRIGDCVSYVGLRADEAERKGIEFESIGSVTIRYPMREWGWGLGDVLSYLDEEAIIVPERTDCGSCFYQTLSEWWNLWRNYLDRYLEYEAMEKRVSDSRGKPCTFRSPGRDSWPAGLAELRERFERGDAPRGSGQSDMFSAAKCVVCRL